MIFGNLLRIPVCGIGRDNRLLQPLLDELTGPSAANRLSTGILDDLCSARLLPQEPETS